MSEKELTAREMFEERGYTCTQSEEHIIYEKSVGEFKQHKMVVGFYLKEKKYTSYLEKNYELIGWSYEPVATELDAYRIIQKQVNELWGW